MQKTKKNKLVLVIVLMFSLLTMYGAVPVVNAASMESAKDTLSDSDLGVSATHTLVFNLGVALGATDYLRVDFATQFGDATDATVTCPNAGTPAEFADYVTCTGAVASTSDQTLTIAGVSNPASASSYNVTITSYTSGNAEIESSQMKVYIIDDVKISAHVDASLTFSISGTSTDAVINGVTTTGDTTATSVNFGALPTNNTRTLGQELTVSTNAADGYVVTVQQSDEMTSAAGANINSFKNAADDTGTTTPQAWSNPTAILGQANTYGHMGLTTSDGNEYGVADFTGSKFAGLNGTAPMTIMAHNGPADGITLGAGKADVAYNVRISDLQEAGDYSAYLTYICTASY